MTPPNSVYFPPEWMQLTKERTEQPSSSTYTTPRLCLDGACKKAREKRKGFGVKPAGRISLYYSNQEPEDELERKQTPRYDEPMRRRIWTAKDLLVEVAVAVMGQIPDEWFRMAFFEKFGKLR